jgi:serine/threonine protein kinase
VLQNIRFLNTTVNSVHRVILYIYSVGTYADGCVIGTEGEAEREHIPGYEEIKVLGKGGFGKVVLAKQTSAGVSDPSQDVATKFVPKEDVCVAEGKVLIQGLGHPFVVQVLLFFETKVLCSFLNAVKYTVIYRKHQHVVMFL